jgi:formate hydrogenlyase transcriptional activator
LISVFSLNFISSLKTDRLGISPQGAVEFIAKPSPRAFRPVIPAAGRRAGDWDRNHDIFRSLLKNLPAERKMSKVEVEQLNWSAAALPAILDSLSTYILTLDRRGRVTYTSRSWLKFAQENGVAWLQMEPGADYLAVCRDAAREGDPLAQRAFEGIEAVLAGRFGKMSLEYPSRGAMGRQRWFLMNIDPLPAGHGGVVISHFDITEHKQMETALADREAKFRGIYESNIVPIAFWDRDGRITNANDAYLRLTGYSRTELDEGKLSWRNLTPPDYLRLDKQAIQEAKTKGLCAPYEQEYLRQDGKRVPVLIGGGMLPGMPDRGVVFAIDLSERKKVESALRESEEKNRAILQALPDMIFVQSKEGVYLDFHAKDPRALLVPPEQFLGKNMSEVLPPELAQTFTRGFELVTRSSEPVILDYSLLVEGETRNYEARMVQHNGDKILSVVRDITERKRSEQALQDLVAGTAVTGEGFFPAYVRRVAAALDVQYAGVAELTNDRGSRLRTLAAWVRNGWAENYEYDVTHAPCGQVVREGKLFYCRERVQETFPQCSALADLNAVSYMGAPLFNSTRQLIGNLCIIDNKPLGNEQRAKSILEIFAARAAAEIERKHAEEELKRALAEVERLKERLEAENVYLREEVSAAHRHREIIGESEGIRKVLQQVEQVAGTDMTVLIMGETGTGKELVARAVHERSERRERSLVKVNCSALPGELIESELFGHEKGAFTGATGRQVGRFELADGGTIFLDEVGDLPLKLQAKLLRVLQEGEFERLGSGKTIKVDVRVIAATNRNLAEAMQRGRFRLDLYYRLNVYPIQIPALRERREDIGLLAQTFLGEVSRRLGRVFDPVPAEVLEVLRRYEWPGNVRELQNVIERAAVVSSARRLELPEAWGSAEGWKFAGNWPASTAQTQKLHPLRSLEETSLDQVGKNYILRILEQTGWRVEGPKGAAVILGLNPSTLRSRMQKLGIRRPGRARAEMPE